jgi:hypothetical protein
VADPAEAGAVLRGLLAEAAPNADDQGAIPDTTSR